MPKRNRIDFGRVKVNIVEDRTCLGPRGGTLYRVEKWVFSNSTGFTLDHDLHVRGGLTLKQARSVKRDILRDYRGE